MFRHTITASLLACLSVVSGHGGGQHYIIDGVTYRGNEDVLNNTEGSIQRLWEWDYHNYDKALHNPDQPCGHTGEPSSRSLYAPIVAGNTVSVNYTVEAGRWTPEEWAPPQTFGHPYGPILAYMAACPDDGCENLDLHSPIWFKIWEAGLLSGTWKGGHWAMRDVHEGANLDIPTPTSLKPGKYLFRHEMVNLETGPVQYFANCVQLEVSGEGRSLPSLEELVAFPGAYDKDLDKSYSMTRSDWFHYEHADDTFYPIPGPPVWEA